MELQFEVVNRVEFGEEHRWTALVEGDEGFQSRKQHKEKDFDGE